MRKLVLLVTTIVLVLVVIMAGSFVLFETPNTPSGFEVSSLRAPSIVMKSSVERIQHNSSTDTPPLNLGLNWSLTPIYSGMVA